LSKGDFFVFPVWYGHMCQYVIAFLTVCMGENAMILASGFYLCACFLGGYILALVDFLWRVFMVANAVFCG